MKTGATTARQGGRRKLVQAAVVLAAVLVPLALVAQGPVQERTATKAPMSADDEILAREGYVSPPPELATAVLAPRYLNVALTNASPDKQWFLDEIGDGPVPMKTFSKPFHELGGQFIDFKGNRARSLTIRNSVGIQIISAADGTKRKIEVPAGARVSNATWSPDGKTIAYFVLADDATQIWIADVATGKSRQLTRTSVLATLDTSFDFTDDGKHIVTVLVPDNRRPMPVKPVEPTGPRIRMTEDAKNRLRTYPSLMSTPFDLELLEWHATGQLALVDTATGAVAKVGQPAMIRSVDPSPDGTYLRVTTMTKPFSYIVPVSSFGSLEEIWDQTGKVLAKISDRPLNLGAVDDTNPAPQAGGGRGGNQTGKREVSWRPDGKGLTYLEQEPAPPSANGRGAGGRGGRGGGDAQAAGDEPPAAGGRGQAARKDRVYQWLPPFGDSDAKVIYENNARMSSHRYSPDMKILFYRESSGQSTTDYAVYLDQPAERHQLVRYRSSDFYANPGTLASTRGGGGGRGGGFGRGGGGGSGPVLLSADGSSVFYQGTLYDKDPEETAPRSFLDRVVIKTGEKSRVFETSNANVSERLTTIVDPDAKRFIISTESPTKPTQYVLVNGSERRQLTNNEDIAPDLTSAPKQRFTVSRADGFKFWVKVTLPPGYQAGTRLPALFWFYPREYATQESYDDPNRNYDKNAFIDFGTRSMQFFVRLGYAVVEPDSPIVGPQGQMNNNYASDLLNDLSAVIDELDRRQLVDRQRLAIGGHSYGAFSTVNAMVHTPFFKAGIAGDGNYNRTFTPLGFQNERRDLWEAPNVYLDMSPFLQANHLTGALLMYHGMGDQNVGTDPDNSIRLFHALNGLGKTAALYMYPLEDHGPASKETLLDLWARWAAWLDKYVKNPQPVNATGSK